MRSPLASCWFYSSLAVLSLVAATPIATAEEAPLPLEKELKVQAPKIVDYLNQHQVKTVGVLKFMVKQGDKEPSAKVGPLNSTLATRLEIALAQAVDINQPINITHDASAKAGTLSATLKGADHRTLEGRELLFKEKYPLSWGNRSDQVQAFLTGEAELRPDLKSMRVRVLAYRPKIADPDTVVTFTASTAGGTLSEAGKTFFLRKMSHRPEGSDISDDPSQEANQGLRQSPLNDPDRPINLEIFYNNRCVFDGATHKFDIQDGETAIPEPQKGEVVWFRVSRTDKAVGRLGVVVAVNGKNTVYEEEGVPPDQFTKWILDLGDKPVPIRGFYNRGEGAKDFKVSEFEVLSTEESRDAENIYKDPGLILFRVYRAATEQPPAHGDKDAAPLRSIRRGTMPSRKEAQPADLGELRAWLKDSKNTVKRGMIAKSEQSHKADLEEAVFTADPMPIMSANLRYYKKQN